MTFPIIYNSTPCGTLKVHREGLYTVFSAESELRGGVLRLWLGTYSLGVMQPSGGKLTLCRRLTKAQLAAVPSFDRAVLSHERPAAAPALQFAPSKWQPRSDGTLISDSFIAIPAELRRVPPGVRLETIDGRQYLLFRY